MSPRRYWAEFGGEFGGGPYDGREVAAYFPHELALLVEDEDGGEHVLGRREEEFDAFGGLVLAGVEAEDEEAGVEVVEVET